jgi:serine/threonine-protein kinase RsbW
MSPACLAISSELSELAHVGAWLNDWTQRHAVPAPMAERLDLCSTEVITNIMAHGYTDRSIHQITVSLDWQGDCLALEVQDDGRPFDPRQAEEPPPAASLEEVAIGGWGLQIVRRFSDEWRYHRANGRNHLTLIFRPALPGR